MKAPTAIEMLNRVADPPEYTRFRVMLITTTGMAADAVKGDPAGKYRWEDVRARDASEAGLVAIGPGERFLSAKPRATEQEVIPISEYAMDETWHCPCGNCADGGGFHPVLPAGVRFVEGGYLAEWSYTEPDDGGPWENHLICDDCGQVYLLIEREAA